MDLAGSERGQPGGGLRNEPPADGVEVGGAGVLEEGGRPAVVGIADHPDHAVRRVGIELEGPRAHGVAAEVLAVLPDRLGRDGRQDRLRDRAEKRGEGPLELHHDRVAVDDRAALVGPDPRERHLGLQLGVDDAVERELDGVGGQRRAVVELDVLAEDEPVLVGGGVDLPFLRQAGQELTGPRLPDQRVEEVVGHAADGA